MLKWTWFDMPVNLNNNANVLDEKTMGECDAEGD